MNIFQRKYYHKLLQAQPKPRPAGGIPRVSSCENVCFLYHYTSENQMMQDWEGMKHFHDNFYVVLFYEGKPYQGQFFNKLNVFPFPAEQFNFFGRVPAETLSKLQSRHYGLLINTMDSMDERMAVLHQWIPADFKIGRNADFSSLNDLSLLMHAEDGLSQYLQQVREYTDKLNG